MCHVAQLRAARGNAIQPSAAVKSQYDFIKSKVPGSRIIVHEYCGESGAIGAALEAIRVVGDGETSFVQMEAAENIEYTTLRNESTRCFFCKNKCLRTFIDTVVPSGEKTRFIVGNSCEKGSVETVEDMKKVKGMFDEIKGANPNSTRCFFCKNKCLRTFIDTVVPSGEKTRFIVGNSCEKGSVETVEDMKKVKGMFDEIKGANPNFVDVAATEAFARLRPPKVETPTVGKFLDTVGEKLSLFESKFLQRNGHGENGNGKKNGKSNGNNHKTQALMKLVAGKRLKYVEAVRTRRLSTVIGMPRVLNMYSAAPFFTAYFAAIGVNPDNIVFSEQTNQQMFKEGSRRGSIDACFPSKVCISHVHDLIFNQKKKPNIIFFPILHDLKSDLVNTTGSNACPVVSISPEVVKAAFTKEGDQFAENGIRYVAPGFQMADPALFEKQMHECFKDLLGVTREENKQAIAIANEALDEFYNGMLRPKAKEVIEQLERGNRVGVVMLGRPYHNDPM